MTETPEIPQETTKIPKTRKRSSPLRDAVTEIKNSKKKIGLIYTTTFLEQTPQKPRQINVWWNVEEQGRLQKLMRMKQAAGILGYATVSDAVKSAVEYDLKNISHVDRRAAELVEAAKTEGIDMRLLQAAAKKEELR
jgi:hypothetical protein